MGAQSHSGAPNYAARHPRVTAHDVESRPTSLEVRDDAGTVAAVHGREPEPLPPPFSTTWNRDGKGWSALHPVEQVS
jgi:hypothetical protein